MRRLRFASEMRVWGVNHLTDLLFCIHVSLDSAVDPWRSEFLPPTSEISRDMFLGTNILATGELGGLD